LTLILVYRLISLVFRSKSSKPPSLDSIIKASLYDVASAVWIFSLDLTLVVMYCGEMKSIPSICLLKSWFVLEISSSLLLSFIFTFSLSSFLMKLSFSVGVYIFEMLKSLLSNSWSSAVIGEIETCHLSGKLKCFCYCLRFVILLNFVENIVVWILGKTKG
jgi:hypothetical protein